ncbi:MAG: hypothetical protein JRJ38_12665 [Deltaproteobacteria bacterium]|nr:hypothetical protein [Deltaproteobacteria bacterium]
MTDIGLRLVLQTRPGCAPPQICLPSTLSDTGHTCTSTHAFASSFLQARIAATPLPSATVAAPFGLSHLAARLCASLRVASVGLGLDFARYVCHNIGHHHLAAGPCPAHNLSLHLAPRAWRPSVPVSSAYASLNIGDDGRIQGR